MFNKKKGFFPILLSIIMVSDINKMVQIQLCPMPFNISPLLPIKKSRLCCGFIHCLFI